MVRSHAFVVLERRPFRQQSLGTRFRPPGSLLCVAAREASPSIASACGFRFRTADTSGIIVALFALRSYQRGISPRYISLCAMPVKAYLLLFWPLRLRLGSPCMSFHGSTLLYAECVGSNIGVSTACFDSDQANQTETHLATIRSGSTDQLPCAQH